jgi:RNA recognition motif-containing protein
MNIYVGNLPYNLSESDLKDLFSPFGEVTSAKIIKDNYTNQSKGFGFIEMANVSDGQRAIKELNETSLQDRKIIVNEARPPQTKNRRLWRRSQRRRRRRRREKLPPLKRRQPTFRLFFSFIPSGINTYFHKDRMLMKCVRIIAGTTVFSLLWIASRGG